MVYDGSAYFAGFERNLSRSLLLMEAGESGEHKVEEVNFPPAVNHSRKCISGRSKSVTGRQCVEWQNEPEVPCYVVVPTRCVIHQVANVASVYQILASRTHLE